MKKRFLLFCFVVFFSSSFLSAGTMAKASDIDFRAMDVPLLDGMSYFMSTMDTFASIAGTLAIVLFLVTICWNAFRLWFGTQQVRKAAIDIMLKCLLFTALTLCYRGIQSGVLELSMKIGTLSGGGVNKLSAEFTNLANTLEQKAKDVDEIFNKLIDSAASNGSGLTDKDVEKIMKGFGRTEEEMNQILANKGIKIRQSGQTYLEENAKYAYNLFKTNTIFDLVTLNGAWLSTQGSAVIAAGKGIYNTYSFNKIYKSMSDSDTAKAKQMLKNGEGDRIITLVHAMRDVLVEIETKNPYEGIDPNLNVQTQEYQAAVKNMKTYVNQYLYSPFIRKEGTSNFRMDDLQNLGVENIMVSPGAMIKTSVLMANILFERASNQTNNGVTSKKMFSKVGWHEIFNYIILIIMVICLIFSSIFCVIQYVMCVFEYSITTSIGILFVPCILFDGTKSFASKLITLFTSYFIKITVMLLCLFWVFSTYLEVGMQIVSGLEEPTSLNMFAYLMFTLILGFIVTQNAPQIAVTILNGSPQLSMGEFLHAAGTLAAGAAVAKKVGGAAAKGAVKTADGGISGVAAGVQAGAGVLEGGGTKTDAFKAATKTLGNAWGSGIANTTSRLVLGRDVAQTHGSSVGFRRGNANQIAEAHGYDKAVAEGGIMSNNEEFKQTYAQFKSVAGENGRSSLESMKYINKLDTMLKNAQNAQNSNTANPNGETSTPKPPVDITEKVDNTRQS